MKGNPPNVVQMPMADEYILLEYSSLWTAAYVKGHFTPWKDDTGLLQMQDNGWIWFL
jgi:hypothetical protein